MATETPSSPPARYVTLRDYLRVLRRYRLMIVALAILGAGAGYLAASRQTPSYSASAQISFQDPSQDLSIAGIGSNASQTPGQVAAINADTATAPSVMAAAQRKLHTPLSTQDLADAVSAQVAVPSGLLDVSATDTDPHLAYRIANAVAGAIVDRANAQTHSQFTQLIGNVEQQIAKLRRRGAGASSGQLGFYQDELARLNTVADVARSAQLAYPAQVPSSPSTPGKSRNVALGLVLGLLLGVLVAFVRDAMDRRLRNLPDVTSSFRLPVLGHVRDESMGQVISSAAAREDGNLDVEAFRILRRNLDFLTPGGAPHAILVTSAVPEEGKTTVAASLAIAMASAGRRVLLIECDLRRPTLAARLHAQPRPGLTDYLSGEAAPPDVLQTLQFPRSGSANGAGASGNGHGPTAAGHSLVFIAAGARDPRSAELLGSSRFADFLAEVGGAYDVVVLDSSPLLPVSDTRELLGHVDAVILCARAAQTTREQATAARAALAHFPQRPTGLVITGVRTHADEYGAYSYAYDEA